MAELDTITLSELSEIDNLGPNDSLLVESGGRMKRLNGNAIGGGIYILDLSKYIPDQPDS